MCVCVCVCVCVLLEIKTILILFHLVAFYFWVLTYLDTTRLKYLMLKCKKTFKNVFFSKRCLIVYCFDAVVEFERDA